MKFIVKVIFSSFMLLLCQAGQAQIVIVDDFRAQCEDFVNTYNKDGAKTISFEFKDWQGFTRQANIKAKISSTACVTNSTAFSLSVVKTEGTRFSLNFFFEDQGNGSLKFYEILNECAGSSVEPYLEVLRKSGYAVTPNVRQTVTAMYTNDYCPKYLNGVKQAISDVAKELAQ